MLNVSSIEHQRFHRGFKLFWSPESSLDHLVGSCLQMLLGALRKPSASGPGRLRCCQTKQSLRLLGVQSTCGFPTVDVSNDETSVLLSDKLNLNQTLLG